MLLVRYIPVGFSGEKHSSTEPSVAAAPLPSATMETRSRRVPLGEENSVVLRQSAFSTFEGLTHQPCPAKVLHGSLEMEKND